MYSETLATEMAGRVGKFEAIAPTPDDLKLRLELTCPDCGQVVCDIEAGDSLEILVLSAASHECSVPDGDDDDD